MGDLKIKLKLFRCRQCNRQFTSAHALSNHMHFHTRRLGRQPNHPLSSFSSSSDDDGRATHKGKALADLGPDPPPARPTPEECAAWNLMFLARDSWERTRSSGSGNWPRQARRARTRYVCGTCGKAFPSPQSLGGHRAGHVKATADQAQAGPEL